MTRKQKSNSLIIYILETWYNKFFVSVGCSSCPSALHPRFTSIPIGILTGRYQAVESWTGYFVPADNVRVQSKIGTFMLKDRKLGMVGHLFHPRRPELVTCTRNKLRL